MAFLPLGWSGNASVRPLLLLVLAPVIFLFSQSVWPLELPLTVVPANVEPGDKITVTGDGFSPSASGLVWGGGLFISGGLDTPGLAYRVAVSGDYAYIADGDSGLHVIDVSNPAVPVAVGSVDTPNVAFDVAVSRGYAYITEIGFGLQIIDVSNPAGPVAVGSVDMLGTAYGVAVSGDYAYVGGINGLQVIDVSNPAAPETASRVVTADWVYDVALTGDYAYVAVNRSGLQVIDVSNPAAPVAVAIVNTPGRAIGVALAGGYAYVADSDGGLQVVDVSNPAAPVVVGSVNTPELAYNVAVSGVFAYVAGYNTGLQVIDLSNPAAPVVVGSVNTPGNAFSVAVSGAYAYVAAYDGGLQVINVSKPVAPVAVGSVTTAETASGVAIAGRYAYVAGGYSGLQVIDVSDPAAPVAVGSVNALNYAYDLALSGGYAYVADSDGGLQVIDVSNPAAPVVVGSVNTPGSANDVALSGAYAYVADSDGGLQVIDVSNPAAPVVVGSVNTPGNANGLAVSGDYAYIADGDSGLQVIDVGNPAAPVAVGSVDTPDFAYGAAVSGGYVFIADAGGGLQIVDVSNPAAPVVVGSAGTLSRALDVAVAGDYAYVASDFDGLQVIDVSNPVAAVAVGGVDTRGRTRGVVVAGGYAYAADSDAGLQVITKAQKATSTFINATTLRFTVPAELPAGIYDVTVVNPDGMLYRARNALTVSGSAGTPLPSFIWPVASSSAVPSITQDYSCRGYANVLGGNANCRYANRHHSGIDFEAAIGTTVMAAAEGTVRKVCISGNPENQSQDPASPCFTGVSQSDQLGTVIVVEHAGGLYSLYAHLSEVAPGILPGAEVNAGAPLGFSGDTGNVTGPHLHFEIKDSDGLISIDAGNIYPLKHPNLFGYADPWALFSATRIEPTAIEVVFPEGINVRRGPGTQYAALTELSNGQRFVAFAQAEIGDDSWYRIHLPCGNDNSCAGWVAGDYQGSIYTQPVTGAMQVEVSDTAQLGLNIRSSPGGSIIDKIFDRQRFVAFETLPSGNGCATAWRRIHTPLLLAQSASGWVCGGFLSLSAPGSTSPSSFQGTVSGVGGSSQAGVTINITGPSPQMLVTDANGEYVFASASAGAYVITPVLAGTEFHPPAYNINAAGADYTSLDFRACDTSVPLSGYVLDATANNAPLAGVTVNAGGLSAQSDSTGYYEIAGLGCATHTVAVDRPGYVAYEESLDRFERAALDVRLTREATVNGAEVESAIYGDPVNTATGNYLYQVRDLEVGGIGQAVRFDRTYNSRAASELGATAGPMGFGWSHSYIVSLDDSGAGQVTITWGDGRTESWTDDGTGTLVPQYGVFDALSADGRGGYTLERRDLTAYQFASTGELTAIRDRNGNTVSLSYGPEGLSEIVDTAGRSFVLTYDGAGRLVQLTDPIGRTVQYGYDAAGNLVAATDPNGNTTHYGYDGNHQIVSVVDPRSNTMVSNSYDADRRVVTYQTDAKGNPTTYVYQELDRITTITDGLGHVTVHDHDELLRLVREVDGRGGVRLYDYDAAGNRVRIVDENGNATQYRYDERGNVVEKADALGQTTAITYDAQNNPLSRTDALGRVTTFTYDAVGNLVETVDPLGQVRQVTYDGRGLPLTQTDALGRVSQYAYDAEGNRTQVTDPAGQVSRATFDGVGRVLTRTDVLGRVTEFTYDANDNLLTVTDPAGGVLAHAYDGNDNRVQTTNANGQTTVYVYDEKNLLIEETDPLGNTETHAYDALDRRVSTTDRLGRTTTHTYDAVGNRTSTTDPLGNTSRFTYDPNGNVVAITDPLGQTTTQAYDALDRLVRTTDPLGHVGEIGYDAVGNRVYTVDPVGERTDFAYDALNRLVQTTDPLGHVETTSYDAADRVAATTDANGRNTNYGYDVLDRLTSVTDPAGGVLQYTYDAAGNRTSMTDPNGNTTTYSYDALDRLVTTTEPLGHVTTRTYDALGNLLQRTDANGQVTQYSYDARNRTTGITYAGQTPITFDYDAVDNLVQMTDHLGATVHSYDAADRRISTTDPFGRTVGYGYDANGNRTSLVYPGALTVTYAFDAADRLTTVTDWAGRATRYSYDAADRVIGVEHANGTSASYSHDAAGRLTGLVNALPGGAVLSSYDYSLDPVGNPVSEERSEPLGPEIPEGIIDDFHDAENRLLQSGAVVNTFDANGNQTGKGTDGYLFDSADRLVQTTVDGLVTDYQYDGLGHRYARMRDGATTRYVLDTQAALTNVLMDTRASGEVEAYNVYGLGLISRIDNQGDARVLHYDPRGSTIALTNEFGAVTDEYAYDPFGQLANRTGADANPFRYLGRHGVLDEGGDLNYIRARYYDAEQQRFIRKDDFLGEERNAQTRHRYAYALNNPVRWVDVSGFAAKDTIEILSTPVGPSNASESTLHMLREDDGGLRRYLEYLKTAGKYSTKVLSFLEFWRQEDYGLGLDALGAAYVVVGFLDDVQRGREIGIVEEQTIPFAIIKFSIGFAPGSGSAVNHCDVISGEGCSNAVDRGLKEQLNSGAANEAFDACKADLENCDFDAYVRDFGAY